MKFAVLSIIKNNEFKTLRTLITKKKTHRREKKLPSFIKEVLNMLRMARVSILSFYSQQFILLTQNLIHFP